MDIEGAIAKARRRAAGQALPPPDSPDLPNLLPATGREVGLVGLVGWPGNCANAPRAPSRPWPRHLEAIPEYSPGSPYWRWLLSE